ncbi:MAG: leucine-rich repeat domain-containing protein [Gammaproteobacteria bacterium]|nr:leucine-rich repeat domain-containing protein [Gammaproteobacteria bacterium]
MRGKRCVLRRAAKAAWQLCARGAVIVAVAVVAGCGDESVVAPPPPAAEPAALSSAALSAGPMSDRDILIVFYEATDGPNWLNSENWLTDAPLGEWYGVETDASGRVIQLVLNGEWNADEQRVVTHGLSGPIPAELGGLTALKWLHLWGNEVSGTIPTAFGRLAHLETMNLGNNELSGTIPAELGGLTNLQSLYLNSNELSGPVPAELGGLTNLQFLNLGNNELSGPIPVELGGLTDLQFLYLGINELTGPIPAELGGLASLETLSLWSNELSGTIPAELGGLASLFNLDLNSNQFSGPIPRELGDLANLIDLDLSSNQFSGTVPLSFLQLSQLRVFRFHENAGLCLPANLVVWYEAIEAREGPVCPDLEVLRTLHEATGGENWTNAEGWLGSGPIGEWYGIDVDASGRVSTVDLEGNGLTGSLPDRIGDLAGLTTLRIGDNALSGRLPSSLSRTPLQELRYASTELCVPAEAWVREWLATIPHHEGTGVECPPLSDREILIALYEATGGPDWTGRGNWLTDAPLGEWYGVEADGEGRVVSLDLRSNGLEGPIPRELGGLAGLETLILFENQLTGSIPAELGELAEVRLVVLAANQLSGPIPAELGALADVEELFLNDNQLTSVPAELGGLSKLLALSLASNDLTSIPGELGELGNLRTLELQGNQLASVPAELGRLAELVELHLHFNELTSVPEELGDLGSLRWLDLEGNRLASVPAELGRLAELKVLWLNSNELTSVPEELGDLGSLQRLFLQGNRLASIPAELGMLAELQLLSLASNEITSIPEELGELRNLRELYLDGNRLTDVPPGLRGFASLEILDLSSNEMSGSLPAGLVELTGLTSLGVADNAGLAGALPLDLTALERLEDLHTTGTELCAPADPTFLDWLEGVTRQRVALCGPGGDAAAYLTQVVQSREFPVPLVAGEPALLRVFVTTQRGTDAGMPPVRATFYQDGDIIHEVDIPGKSDPIPAAIDESSLSKSVNAEIPGWVIQPGLEVVIEPDPDGTLDPALGVARRIPATGRMAVNVHAVPVFELTLLPFIWEESPDASILEVTAAMADDPEGHELLEHTRLLLPISAMDVRAHGSVATSTNNGFEIMGQTEMIRVAEGGRGHYLGVMAPPTTPGSLGGVAYQIGSWSSFSKLDSEIIAHEFGHNRNLYHAPCGGAGGPDRYYPYGSGNIGAWGYDPRIDELVAPAQSDLMSYCDPQWISDYQFTNALRYRLETESGSILVAAAAPPPPAGRALLLWGGLDATGTPHIRPAFFIDAPPTLPRADGSYSLTGRDPSGTELFSLSFEMAEFTDTEDDRAGFAFALPATWTQELASIALQGPGGSASLDRDTDDPLTILRDPATGQIRDIVDSPPPAGPGPGPAAVPGPELEVLFSRGIPSATNELR